MGDCAALLVQVYHTDLHRATHDTGDVTIESRSSRSHERGGRGGRLGQKATPGTGPKRVSVPRRLIAVPADPLGDCVSGSGL